MKKRIGIIILILTMVTGLQNPALAQEALSTEVCGAFLQQAQAGDPEAQYQLGLYYEFGDAAVLDCAQAAVWYQKAAGQGHMDAQYRLGLMYEYGYGVAEQDTEQATYWYGLAAAQGRLDAQEHINQWSEESQEARRAALQAEAQLLADTLRAAEKGDARAQCQLGHMYVTGDGLERNITEAVKWYLLAAGQGNAEGQYQLGRILEYSNGGILGETWWDDLQQSVYWYQKAAEQGYLKAQVSLGYMYSKNCEIDDYDEAFPWIQMAAKQGDAWAQYNMGYMYATGTVVEEDTDAALKWFRRAAKQGFLEAQISIGWKFREDAGAGREEEIYWLKQAIEQGSPEAESYLGCKYLDVDNELAFYWLKQGAEHGFYEEERNYEYAYEDYYGVSPDTVLLEWNDVEAAQNGDAEAQYRLGWAYQNGEGRRIKRDDQQAFYWYQQAAENGKPEAQRHVAEMLEEGTGTEQDVEKAMDWYRKAGENGDVDAMRALARLYEGGEDAAQNTEQMLFWYWKAAKYGDPYAMYKIVHQYTIPQSTYESFGYQFLDYGYFADLYFRNVETDEGMPPAQSAEQDLQSAQEGEQSAQTRLGYRYYNGIGVTDDYELAASWYRKAAEQGSAAAQYSLGLLYKDGEGVKQDYAQAVEWIRLAAEQGYPNAQAYLGFSYCYGLGAEQNTGLAVHWLSKAAEQNDIGAQALLGDIYGNMRTIWNEKYTDGLNEDVPRNSGFEEQEMYWYRKAAEQGNAMAQYQLSSGLYEHKDDVQAAMWLLKAAEQNNVDAMLSLSLSYEYGSVVERDMTQAVNWMVLIDMQCQDESITHYLRCQLIVDEY